MCDWRTELVPASEDADEFAAVAEDEDEFLCDCVSYVLLSFSHSFCYESLGRICADILSVRSSSCAAVVNICGGNCGGPPVGWGPAGPRAFWENC